MPSSRNAVVASHPDDSPPALQQSADSPRPILPLELIEDIVSYLDPTEDRQSLINVLGVSTTWWEAGASVLYRDMTLDPERLRLLICGGQPADLEERRKLVAPDRHVITRQLDRALQPSDGMLSPRTRRALGFVESLTLIASFVWADYVMLCSVAAAVPNVPLFPRVRKLRLRSRSDSPYTGVMDGTGGRIPRVAGDDVLFFDCPDVCMAGGVHSITPLCLPARQIPSLCAHDILADNLLEYHLPRQGESIIIYDEFVGRFAGQASRRGWLSKWENDLVKRNAPRVRLCFRYPDEGRDILDKLEADADWRPDPTAKVQLLFFDSSGDGCPPCNICGRFQMCY